MGSNETATATTGGPRVIAYLTVTGCRRDQIAHFLWWYISPWRPLEVGLVVCSRLCRIRHRCGSLELPESSVTNCQAIHGFMSSIVERIGRLCPEPGRMRCRRLRTSTTDQKRPLGDLRAANRQDFIDAAVMAGPTISRINKIIFFAPQFVSH